jgi:hypothetical protein
LVCKTKIYPCQLFIQLFHQFFFHSFKVSLCPEPKPPLNPKQSIIHRSVIVIVMCILLFQILAFSLSAMVFCSLILPLQLLTPSMFECKCVIQLLIVQIYKGKGANQIWSNLEEGYEEPSMLPQIFNCLCSLNIVGKWGTPFMWCRYLWCVHKCYFQICFPLSIFSFCICSTILYFFLCISTI